MKQGVKGEDLAERLVEACRECGLEVPPAAAGRVEAYASELARWQASISLSTVRDVGELVRFHFVEAFWAGSVFLERDLRLADIGSGAGFPGIGLKLFRPGLSLVLLEKNAKKCAFLKRVGRTWGMPLEVVNENAERWGGWATVAMATVRALRLEEPVLRSLRASSVKVLQFRGERSERLPADWRILKEARFPLAEARWVTLYEPPMFHVEHG